MGGDGVGGQMARCRRAAVGSALGALVLGALLLASLPAAGASGAEDRPYAYRSYGETMAYFKTLKSTYPDLVETWIAQEAFPEILPSKQAWARCGSENCRTLIVRIANKKRLENKSEALKRPEVFFSGALHGDERLGPLVVTELAGFLCSQYKEGNAEIQRLVDTRNTWIMPMTNAFGYAHSVRHENGMDPNRDFPYRQAPSKCMMTQTGRAVNELFRRHLFQYTLTFHGGMRALTYEWGSFNHMVRGKSTESPDDEAFTEVGRQIRAASGLERNQRSWYPFGRINDMVYPVDGGMEDWSYAAGFERSPSPITVCHPLTYGGYAESRTRYREGSVATLVYLAEMDDAKTPRTSTLGSTAQVWGLSSSQGHVARNLRMCLKLIELTKPEVVIQPPAWPSALQPDAELALEVHGFGCISLSAARLLLLPREGVMDCGNLEPSSEGEGAWAALLASAVPVAALPGPVTCRGLSIWERPASAAAQLRGRVPSGLRGSFCAAVAAEFDQDWARQARPDPAMKPRAHAARLRLEEHYFMQASDGLDAADGPPMRIDEHRIKLFPALASELAALPDSSEASRPRPALRTAAPTPTAAAAAGPVAAAAPAAVGEAAGLPAPSGAEAAGPAASKGAEVASPLLRGVAAVALLGLGGAACQLAGVCRLARRSCRSLPPLFGRNVIGRPEDAAARAGAAE